MLMTIGAILGVFAALCGVFLTCMLLLSPENEDLHFGHPKQ